MNIELKVGDLIKPKPHYSYENTRCGTSTFVKEAAPPCVVTTVYRFPRSKEVMYIAFHCSWDNKTLMMKNPELDWCEVLNENR